ncbi:hypothetical protein [Pedobacter cryoconitis]|uniref:Lipoprotein n=1 Tax=Pedobacter cryoconitis TaxID=188932 RepID=A0A7X0MM65_9SPHI|nr:hypothetical protein [Pedobacter cryoconitis]MBB6502143.1 hypothetical protein [Pedobacter cryoconitis]
MLHKFERKYLLVLISITGLAGCLNPDQKRALYNAQLDVFKKTDVYHQVQLSTQHSLRTWISSDLQGVQKLRKSNWKVDDAVFFNQKRDKCYLLLLIQHKDLKASQDEVDILYGTLENEQWTIYFSALPPYLFSRKSADGDNYEPVSLQTLSLLARDKILKNYYKRHRRINDAYVNSAYNDRLKKEQENFLHKK